MVVAVFVALLAVSGRLVYLQVLNHDRFTTLSESNRVRLQPLPPTRGFIYDRNGVLLADNLASYHLEVTPDQTRDLDATLDVYKRQPHEVRTPSVQKISFWATGTPVNGPASPRWRRWSAARACVKAASAVTVIKAFSPGLNRSIRSRKARVSSSLLN